MPDTKATTLFDVSAVKAWVGVTGVDATADARLTLIADAVSERMEAVTKRYFVTRAVVDTLNGDGSTRLALRKWPVATMTGLTVKDSPDQATPTALVAGTDYDVDNRLGIIRTRGRRLTRGFQNIVATYTAGWDVQNGPKLPQDVYQAGLDYVKAVYDELSAGSIAATSVSLGNSTFMLKPQLPYGIKSVLDQWRAVRL